MSPGEHEQVAVEQVCKRLSKLPNLPGDVIERAVHEIHDQLDGPIRDYVPVLVEHMARDHFTAMTLQAA